VGEPLLEVRDLRKHFPVGGSLLAGVQGWVKAVDGISFAIHGGETLGLVGESGCGKTTTSKLILAAEKPTSGAIEFEGRSIASLHGKELMDYRRKVQVVFQDPFSSLSPRMRVGEIIGEPIETHERISRRELQSRVQQLLELVGLRPDMARLFPHEFSGGQRQRLAIARALSTNARLIVLDEPVSALDVSIRAHIISLLEEIQARLGVSYLFIAHDLAAVAHLSHQTAVMYLGKLVEVADSLRPRFPPTRMSRERRSSWPARSPARSTRRGAAPSTLAVPLSCRAVRSKSPRWSSGHRAATSPVICIRRGAPNRPPKPPNARGAPAQP
jgi:peptide/nickel transport system ATP-binding protein